MKFIKLLSYVCFIFFLATCSKDEGNEEEIDTSANLRSVGDSANDLLSAQQYNSIRFEIFYVTGFEPTSAAINNFEAFLGDRLNKPGGIQIILKEIASPGQAVYSINDIRNLEDSIRTEYNIGNEIAVFGLFIDGEYSENTSNASVLGVAYRNTSFVIFDETIKSFSSQPFSPSTTVLESTVLNHEFGHLMGLVNAGTPLQSDHQDIANGRHCDVDNCLMFFAAETGEGLINMISGGSIPSLDAQCMADLQANGGK